MQMVMKTWLYGDAFRALLDMDMAMDNNSDDSGVSNSIALPPLSSTSLYAAPFSNIPKQCKSDTSARLSRSRHGKKVLNIYLTIYLPIYLLLDHSTSTSTTSLHHLHQHQHHVQRKLPTDFSSLRD